MVIKTKFLIILKLLLPKANNMDQNLIIQNTDTPNENPLSSSIEPNTKSKFTLPKNPKILALMIMGIFIAILFVVATIVTIVRSSSVTKIKTITKPTPTTTTQVATPTASQFPEEFRGIIDTIQQDLHQNNLPDPPQIDETIGL